MSSREEGAPVCKAHPVPMTTLGSEMAYQLCHFQVSYLTVPQFTCLQNGN